MIEASVATATCVAMAYLAVSDRDVRLLILMTTAALMSCQGGGRVASAPTGPVADDVRERALVGYHELELPHDSRGRTAVVYVPPGLGDAPAPLVLLLHGGFGTGEHAMKAYDMPARADEHGFVLVAPDGFRRTWNAGRCCGPSVRRNIDDVGFLRALVTHVSSLVPVDEERVYATGMSNGAAMSYRLACEASDVFAAVAPVAGLQTFEPCEPAEPVALLHIHGDQDQNVPLGGGVGTKGVSKTDWPSLDSVAEQWRTHNNCTDEPEESYRRNKTTCVRNAACADETTVEVCVVAGAGHVWPPFEASLTKQPTSTDLDASDAVVEFLLRHRR